MEGRKRVKTVLTMVRDVLGWGEGMNVDLEGIQVEDLAD